MPDDEDESRPEKTAQVVLRNVTSELTAPDVAEDTDIAEGSAGKQSPTK
ncbi:MAG: hypothetical protein ACTHON_17795 [Humibacter sp.]